MQSLKIDTTRYEKLMSGAMKKIKNESVHGDFFYDKKIKTSEED